MGGSECRKVMCLQGASSFLEPCCAVSHQILGVPRYYFIEVLLGSFSGKSHKKQLSKYGYHLGFEGVWGFVFVLFLVLCIC